ncbi:MAG: D-lyxose/D-mannose family sugar isomerase [Bacteroidales bacterium]|nr:D-lyxose/D-mannose family sugar isomerase [Bacteroidales bacterium]
MKRSEINAAIRAAEEFFKSKQFPLPEWAYLSPDEWQSKGKECTEIVRNSLGWDITDFGKGDFLKEGLTLFTVRNGNIKYDDKTYCEKIMMVREGQMTPLHFHWNKMEDIINRGGGTLCMRLFMANPETEEKLSEDVNIKIDGVESKVKAGEIVRLKPGQSITYYPYLYHEFWAENGTCMVGEVSKVNDDNNDNRFYDQTKRFSDIIDDEKPFRLLCNEYKINL